MCSIEETLACEGKMPAYYRRYVDDTLTIMPDKGLADNFLQTLSHSYSSVKLTMEMENNGMLDTNLIQVYETGTAFRFWDIS